LLEVSARMTSAEDLSGLDQEKQLDDEEFVLPRKGKYADRQSDLRKFGRSLQSLQDKYGLRLSARGYAYLLEQEGHITKHDFDWAEGLVLECIKASYLPVDFVKEDPARLFFGVEEPESRTPVEYLRDQLRFSVKEGGGYVPNWWKDEDYYIQILVEKVDLVTLFRPDDNDIIRAMLAGMNLEPLCQNYHIPIANAKGWSSVLQRATFARRFKEAEQNGSQAVLLYFGDLDPDGNRISDFWRDNLEQIRDIEWTDGETGYDPSDLIIERVGLNYDFIKRYDIPSIDNLKTSSGLDLLNPNHPNHKLPYVQNHIRDYGIRKWEAQAFVQRPVEAQKLCRDAIQRFLGLDAKERFKDKEQAVIGEMWRYIQRSRAEKAVERLIGDGRA
jgi:hypothetical protein